MTPLILKKNVWGEEFDQEKKPKLNNLFGCEVNYNIITIFITIMLQINNTIEVLKSKCTPLVRWCDSGSPLCPRCLVLRHSLSWKAGGTS